MLFAITPVVTVFASCPLPRPHTHTPQKNRRVWGSDWGAEWASPAESDLWLQSSHPKTGGLHMSNWINERVEEHSCEELQRLRKAKFSSPKPPRASGKPSGFMKFQARPGRSGRSGLVETMASEEESGFLQGSRGLLCSVGFSCRCCGCFPCIQSWVRTILRSNGVSESGCGLRTLAREVVGEPFSPSMW